MELSVAEIGELYNCGKSTARWLLDRPETYKFGKRKRVKPGRHGTYTVFEITPENISSFDYVFNLRGHIRNKSFEELNV